MDKKSTTVLVVIFGGLFLTVFGFLALAFSAIKSDENGSASFGGKDGLGVVEVKGQIANLDKQVKAMRKFEKDDHVKGILLRVDSPGGAVAPSQELHDEVLRAIKKGKPVIVSMGNLAASGGYYVSCGASKIYAEPGTMTASIGVITQMPNFTKIAEWAHFRMDTYTSGEHKDLGNPFREPTDEDARFFKSLITNIYDQFLTAVAEGRKQDKEKLRPLADGRVMTGVQAKEANLVDELGGWSDAIDGAMALAKLEGEPHLIYPPEEEKGLMRELLKDGSSAIAHELVGAVRHEVAPEADLAGPLVLLPMPVGAR